MSQTQSEPPSSDDAPARRAGTALLATEGVDAAEQFGRIDRRHDEGDTMPGRIGRFVVLESLGAGGMGIVHAAYDPDLDRRIAIKLWRRDVGRKTGQSEALLAEARAMARVTHPNVVAVHEVGLHAGRMFLAMEYVRGETLRKWLAREPRDWRTIVRTFLDAGRGLVAVHDAGLVHRDFKPDNVMVRDDGRVQVMDFGIAGETTSGESGSGNLRPADSRTPLHVGGAPRLVGTPAFMAPEQFRGGDLDARTDQFSFCVALFTALAGVVPFHGTNVVQLFEAVDAGEIAAVPRNVDVPTRVMDVVRRGLRPEAADRWPDMQTLLARLTTLVQARVRRRWIAAGVLLTGGLAWALASRGNETCDDGRAAMETTWSQPTASRIADAFADAAPGYGVAAWTALEPEIDRIARAWVDQRTQACSVEDPGTRNLQRQCLDERRMVLDTLLGELARADADTVRNAAQVVAGLDVATTCADPNVLRLRTPPPTDPETRAAVEAADREVVRVEHLFDLGHYAEGLEAAHVLVADATAIGFAPLHARAVYVRALHENASGDLARAEAGYREAYAEARRAGLYTVAFDSALALGASIGVAERRFDLGRTWLDVAVTEAELAGRDEGLRSLAATRADLLYAEGLYAESTRAFETLLADAEAARARPAEIMTIHRGLATALGGVGRNSEALAMLEGDLPAMIASRGEGHPDIADVWMGIGQLQGALRRGADAVQSYRRALEIRERALGPRHHLVASTLNNIAAEQMEQGDLQDARVNCERALDILAQTLGPMHPDNAGCLNTLALVHWDRDWAATSGYLRHGVEVSRAALGDHPTVAALLNNLAAAEEKLGDVAAAQAHYREAIAMREASVGVDDPELAYPLKNLGALLQREGRTLEAREILRRAVTAFERADGSDSGDHGAASWALARAMADPPADLEAARELARTALAQLEADTQSPLVQTTADVRAWLAEH